MQEEKFEGNSESIKGIIERITYKNDNNGYTVAVIRVGKEHLTCVGVFPFVTVGESCVFNGEFIVHPTYGRQFSAKSVERVTPATSASILKYLSSGIIKGVGPSTATKIVEKFGDETLDVIQNRSEELALIRGISKDKAKQINEEYKKQFGLKDIMMLLSPYNFSPERCVKIYNKLGSAATEHIKENPYVLCDEEIGVSFETAEKISYDFGISADNINRLVAGVLYIVRSNLSNGHTCLPKSKVISVAVKLLESDIYRIEEIIDRLIANFSLRETSIGDEKFVSLPKYYNSEEYIAARLINIKYNSNYVIPVSEEEINYIENVIGLNFEELQRSAIKSAFETGFLVITGGPGTGKTTTLNAIIQLFENRKIPLMLAAPTGRAAKRMSELTGREAKTIHRLLEVEWTSEDEQRFSRNEKNPLECEVIIVDEASMLDSVLFESLLRALKINCKIILVGDVDQLPSISAGNILSDIISSGLFNTVSLNKVFRQARESLIVTNAHSIIKGEKSDFSNKGKDFFYIEKNNSHDVLNTVLELAGERLKTAYGYDVFKNIQVICPSRKLETGTLNLNNILQSCLNPPTDKSQLSYKGVYYRLGDKVMQIKNNYDIEWEKESGDKGYGIFNGDIGIIKEIDRSSGIMKILFEDRTATYLFEDIEQLELSYAVTVHKSQGSEFDCVILPLFDVPSKLKYRNLLYTAVTRAKKMLIIVGNKEIYEEMAANDKKSLRYTLLKEFLIKNENDK